MLNQNLVSIQRRIFKDFLRMVNKLMDEKHIERHRGFISYAWEDPGDGVPNKTLQAWLSQLKEDFAVLGIDLFLDTINMNGNINAAMQQIQSRDFVFSIGTPRFRERVIQGNTNVAYEFQLTLDKAHQSPQALMPLLYQGDFNTSFPQNILQFLIRDFRDPSQYYCNFVSLNPLGLLPAICPQLQTDTDYALLMESCLQEVWKVQLAHRFREELQLYIPARGDYTAECPNPKPMEAHVEEFMQQRAAKVLLLLGGSGSGKTMFGQYLSQQLAQQYLTPKVALLLSGIAKGKSFDYLFQLFTQEQVVPIWISLPALRDPRNNAIKEGLKLLGVPECHMELFKQKQLLVILDGYDEVSNLGDLYQSNHFSQWNAKLIITCRPESLTTNNYNAIFNSGNQGLVVRYVAPFSKKEIAVYLEKYIECEKEKYQSMLKYYRIALVGAVIFLTKHFAPQIYKYLSFLSKSYLTQIQKKPLNLEKIILSSLIPVVMFLPVRIYSVLKYMETIVLKNLTSNTSWDLIRYQTEIEGVPGLKEIVQTPFLLHLVAKVLPEIKQSSINLTRRALYEQFIQQWFQKHLDRWKVERKLGTLDEEIRSKNGNNQNNNVDNNMRINFLRDFAGRFARALYKANIERVSDTEAYTWAHQYLEDTEPKKLIRSACPLKKYNDGSYGFIHMSLMEYLVTPMIIGAYNNGQDNENLFYLNERILSPAVVQFLADDINENLKKGLWNIIRDSSQKEGIHTAASNAITILNAGRISFSGEDLRRIRIPGADLTGAILDSTQFDQADLTNVSLTGAWLHNASFIGAKMEGVFFGEYPPISKGNDEIVNCCSYSPDGKYLAIAVDIRIELYDANRCLCGTFNGHTRKINSIHFSSDSRRLASGSDDRTVKVWDVEQRNIIITFTKQQYICSVHFSREGKLAAAQYPDTTGVTPVETESLVYVFTQENNFYREIKLPVTDTFSSVHFINYSNTLVCSIGKHLLFYSYPYDGQPSYKWEDQNRINGGVVFSPDESLCAFGSGKQVKLLSVGGYFWGFYNEFKGHTENILKVAFSPDGMWLASASEDKTVKIWDVKTGMLYRGIDGYPDRVTSISFNANSDLLASACSNKLYINMFKNIASRTQIGGHSNRVTCVHSVNDGQLVVSGSSDKTVNLLVNNGQLKASYRYNGEVTSVRFSPDRSFFASSDTDGTIKLWNLKGGLRQEISERSGGRINDICISRDSSRLALGNVNALILWNLINNNRIQLYNGNITCVDFGVKQGNSEYFAFGFDRTVLICTIVDSRTKSFWRSTKYITKLSEECRLENSALVSSVHFSPNGELLAYAAGLTVKLVKITNFFRYVQYNLIPNLNLSHTKDVNSLCFSHDSRYLVSGGYDNMLILWDLSNLNNPIGHSTYVSSTIYSLSFSFQSTQNKSFLVSGHGDHSVRYWELRITPQTPHLQLLWATHQNVLFSQRAEYLPAINLSADNQNLLAERSTGGNNLFFSNGANIAAGSSSANSSNIGEVTRIRNRCIIS